MKHLPERVELKPQRVARRERQRRIDRRNEERNRRKSMGGGCPNELGVTQGQNGEQGNMVGECEAEPLG